MDDKFAREHRHLTGPAALVAAASKDNFGASVLDYVSRTASVKNFGAYYFPDLNHPKPVLSIWSGRIGDYWMRRHGSQMVSRPELFSPILAHVSSAPENGVSIERWHPSEDNPRKPMYDQMAILERVTVASRTGRFGHQSFFLRDARDGWFTDCEFTGLCDILPFVHKLIGLRHHVTGSEEFQFAAGPNVSRLRERGAMHFSKLSRREAEVCDYLISGITVAGTALELGITEATVRTLRQRSYRKLNVNSAAQLMALIVHDLKGE
ncbi:helix-turn-helix transcriptional regulator [Ruegeria sp. HKCCD8929]|uniref:helix-turn-helix transcriptional regulator n=1 Tax=Ruegeria sp. HKCCD8929 TaxID=2683006 RepID=UPI0014880B05|nr:helix-turn-helix transcriptional regulator [Ruegeria sp. HKCCD8929]